MAPTLKDSPTGLSSSDASRLGGLSDSRPSQPVALEIPVTVNGARAVEGTDKREPFSQNTSTVLVFANGAVIRLTSAVQPGQLLFLTNEKTRKEVVCQVVKAKSDRNSSGYVELKFTEPVSGFWGLRFPNERPDASPLSVPHASNQSQDHSSHSPASEGQATPIASVKAETAKEFKTEIKTEAHHLSKADLFSSPESSTSVPKLDSSPLQEQLAALLAMDSAPEQATPAADATPLNPTEVAAQILNIADSTVGSSTQSEPRKQEPSTTSAQTAVAPPATKSNFENDEVKIPAWLQPLARNESVAAPPAHDEDVPPSSEESAPGKPETVVAVKHAELPRKGVSSAAVFGNSLLGESPSTPARAKASSSKGIWIGAIAAVVLLGAGAAWYFHDALFQGSGTAAVKLQTPATVVPAQTSSGPAGDSVASLVPAVEGASHDASSQTVKSASSSIGTSSPPSTSSAPQPKLQNAAVSERIPKLLPTDAAETPAREKDENNIVVVEPDKRLSLGKVRLAKPKVNRSAGSEINPDFEPSLEGNQPAISGGALNSGLVAGNATEPAAPRVEAGGDVKVARMISSVPPVYPALARAQHISGDVRVDALIDATGRVTTMKVVAGPTLLHQSAMDALRQWKYQPATLDGKPIAMHLTVTIQFRLK